MVKPTEAGKRGFVDFLDAMLAYDAEIDRRFAMAKGGGQPLEARAACRRHSPASFRQPRGAAWCREATRNL